MPSPHTEYGLDAITTQELGLDSITTYRVQPCRHHHTQSTVLMPSAHTEYGLDAISTPTHPLVVGGLCRYAFNSHTHSKGQTGARLLVLVPYMDICNLDLW